MSIPLLAVSSSSQVEIMPKGQWGKYLCGGVINGRDIHSTLNCLVPDLYLMCFWKRLCQDESLGARKVPVEYMEWGAIVLYLTPGKH